MQAILLNLVRLIFTKKVAIWAVKLWAKHTENKIDDNVVALIEAGMASDLPGMQKAVEGLVIALHKEHNDKDNEISKDNPPVV